MTDLRHINTCDHVLGDDRYRQLLKDRLDTEGVVVLRGFLTPEAIDAVLSESLARVDEAFFTTSTHNVWLTPPDPNLAVDHILNRQIVSTKGCLADDQIPIDSPLREIYEDDRFHDFLQAVLGIDELHPYADTVSSINVHLHGDGQELGWHFDNSAFAVTLLIQEPEAGGDFEYSPDVRNADAGELGFEQVQAVLEDSTPPLSLEVAAGDLVLFRGRNSIHRVTPSTGDQTRVLVVFAYNTEPGIGLSDEAKETFYGRLG